MYNVHTYINTYNLHTYKLIVLTQSSKKVLRLNDDLKSDSFSQIWLIFEDNTLSHFVSSGPMKNTYIDSQSSKITYIKYV